MKQFDSICVAVGMLIATGLAVESWGASFIAKDGKPMAEIIIATNTPRAVKFAAEELQAYIEKISGAKLAITNEAGQDIPVKIYVGKSKYTEELKISDEGLKHGAYKIMSGNPPRADKWGGWLALIGQDKDFVPPEPHLRNRDDLPRVQAEWDKGTPLHAMTRHILGAFHGQPGARAFRRHLSEHAPRKGSTPEVLREALRHVGIEL